MPTNKIVLRTVEEFMEDYTPVYQPIYPLFLGKSVQYEAEVGKMDFRRANAVGDIRAKHITPKDTEIRQIAVMEGKKSFKKYFLANQYVVSDLQDQQGADDIVTQVLDEHQLQMDELLLLGEGTSNSDVINNGIFYSADSYYLLETSYQVPLASRLSMFYGRVMAAAQKSAAVAGRKVIMLYGADAIVLMNSLMPNSDRSLRVVLGEALGPYNTTIAVVPEQLTPAGLSGFIIVNMDQVKLHYTVLPELMNQGENEEKMYYWFNFMMGSAMLELLAKNAVIRQPITLEV